MTTPKTTKQKTARAADSRATTGKGGAKKVTSSYASRRPLPNKVDEVTEAQMDRLIAASLRRHKKTLDVLADL